MMVREIDDVGQRIELGEWEVSIHMILFNQTHYQLKRLRCLECAPPVP